MHEAQGADSTSQEPAAGDGRKSYTSTQIGPLGRLKEASALVRRHADVGRTVREAVAEMEQVETSARELLGIQLGGRVLEIGSGPNSLQLAYLALRSDALGTDTNIVPSRGDLAGWVQMTRRNGAMRTAKTLTRRALAIDARSRREFSAVTRQPWPVPRVVEMDAAQLELPDASIDFVFSRSVFEHLPEPERVLSEVKRVLKPGGGLYAIFHLYTSDSGSHDPRILSGQRDGLPHWSHLRSAHRHLVQPNAYLNELRLGEWTRLFAEAMPGSSVVPEPSEAADELRALAAARSAGELGDYTDEELLSARVLALWRKPGEPHD